jgi:hypothetical protein
MRLTAVWYRYDTISAKQVGFRCRAVVGGLYAKLLTVENAKAQ